MNKSNLKYLIILVLVLFSTTIRAQYKSLNNKSFLSLNSLQKQQLYPYKIGFGHDFLNRSRIFLSVDTLQTGSSILHNDDPEYNRKYPFIIPVVDVFADNFLTWTIRLSIFKSLNDFLIPS